MTHQQFLANLKKIYKDVTSYNEMTVNHRLDILFDILEEDKDFRYIIPLYVMEDFQFPYFIDYVYHRNAYLVNMLIHLFKATHKIARRVQRSIKSRVKFATIHRTYPAKVNVAHFPRKIDAFANVVTQLENNYKLQAEFFYEHLPHFNHIGPLYQALKDKHSINTWDKLPIQERKITGYNCLIEYYIYENKFPIEGKFIKDDMKKNLMFLEPSLDALRSALKQGNAQLIGYNMAKYDELPATVKKIYRNMIKNDYFVIKEFTKKSDLHYLNNWRLYDHNSKNKESNSQPPI